MSAVQIQRRFGAIASAAAFCLAGCAASAPSGATVFIKQHGAAVARTSAATKAVEVEVARLPRSPTEAQLEHLLLIAGDARRDAVQAGEWNLANPEAEEEDLPRAEGEVTEGANALAKAMAALQAYARTSRADALARYRSESAHGHERWNEGISQLWFQAGKPDPPIV
jgi:hypothetical protein